jgi:hypothetical protein
MDAASQVGFLSIGRPLVDQSVESTTRRFFCPGHIASPCGRVGDEARPLENNIVERSLKKAILRRKNSLFYKSRKGAQRGDLFMSLIHTCELNGANAFDYPMEALR